MRIKQETHRGKHEEVCDKGKRASISREVAHLLSGASEKYTGYYLSSYGKGSRLDKGRYSYTLVIQAEPNIITNIGYFLRT